jgi:hypothetical protein
MRRLFWLALGITLGALIVRKLSNMASKLTPSSMAGGFASSVADLAEAIRDFGADVRAAMSEREAELRAATGFDGSGPAGAAGAGFDSSRSNGSGLDAAGLDRSGIDGAEGAVDRP